MKFIAGDWDRLIKSIMLLECSEWLSYLTLLAFATNLAAAAVEGLPASFLLFLFGAKVNFGIESWVSN